MNDNISTVQQRLLKRRGAEAIVDHKTRLALLCELRERAQVSQWMDWYLTTMHAPLSNVFRTLIRTPEADRDMAAVEKAAEATNRLWLMLEAHLDGRQFVLGDTISIGDIPVGCAVYRWFNMDVERPDLPNVTAWFERLQARQPYQDHVMMPLT